MTHTQIYCLPVRPQGDRFLADEERSSSRANLLLFSHLQHYLHRHHVERHALLQLRGITYRTRVFVSKEPDDGSYALVDSSGVPGPLTSLVQLLGDTLKRYFRRLKNMVQYSEPFPGNRKTYFFTEFVEPRFYLIPDVADARAEERTWQDVHSLSHFIITGEAGLGKTTCLRMLAFEETEKSPEDPEARVPVYLQARKLRKGAELLSLASRELTRDPSFRDDTDFTALCESGRLLILLDGLDEIPLSHRDWFHEDLRNTYERWPQVGLAVTLRDTGYELQLPGFIRLRIRPFSPGQISEWVRRRVGRTGHGVAESLIARLLGDPAMAGLSGNPLLLTIAAGLVETARTTLPREAALIVRFVEALLEDWDESRGVSRWLPSVFSREKKIETLCRTAFRILTSGSTSFKADDLVKWQAPWADSEEREKDLPALWREAGICVPASPDLRTWQFSHPLLVDVLSAKHLVERTDDLFPMLYKELESGRFLSVWRYACEITQDASNLVEFLADQTVADEFARARLLAVVLTEDTSIRDKSFKRGCDVICAAVRGVGGKLSVARNEGDKQHWALELRSAPAHGLSPTEFVAVGELIRALLNGMESRRRVELAQAMTEKGEAIGRAVGERMRATVRAEEKVDTDTGSLIVEGRFVGEFAAPND